MINISEKISSLRKAHNLTQEALGEAVGVSAQAVSKWEKGDSLPDISVIPDICRTFGISADTLIGNEGNMTGEMYLEKALEICKNWDERMNMLHKIMDWGYKNETAKKTETDYFGYTISDAHIFLLTDSRGFGMFFNKIEYIKNMISVDITKSELIKLISDEKTIKIFEFICINGRLNENEIIKLTKFTAQEVEQRLFTLMKNSLIQSDMDTEGNTNKMAYAISTHGILLLGIMANAYLFEPASRKNLPGIKGYNNTNPEKLRKFMD